MILFNVPLCLGNEITYIQEAIQLNKICGDGVFTQKCNLWLEERFKIQKALLTTSGTSALDMAVLLSGVSSGDEVILPSYTFSSTANSVLLAGATPVFVDIRPDTMNIDESKIEDAITEKTKAIIAVHYAGIACEMDMIMDIAHRHNIAIIEDAAQGVMSKFKGQALGTIGDFGCYSFHETKNYSMGEGGALLIKDKKFNEKAEVLREKGTNRAKFIRGQIDKYTWVDFGDSYLPSELNAAYLWGQLEKADEVNRNRLALWNRYYDALLPLTESQKIVMPTVPEKAKHNAHMFYLKLKDRIERDKYIEFMKQNDIMCTFHYIPLHSAPAGIQYCRFSGEDIYTTKESERLVRLPMYYGLSSIEQQKVIDCTYAYFK